MANVVVVAMESSDEVRSCDHLHAWSYKPNPAQNQGDDGQTTVPANRFYVKPIVVRQEPSQEITTKRIPAGANVRCRWEKIAFDAVLA